METAENFVELNQRQEAERWKNGKIAETLTFGSEQVKDLLPNFDLNKFNLSFPVIKLHFFL